jgi:hypothetical protein
MPKPCGNPFERAQDNKDFKKGSKWEWMMIDRFSLSVNGWHKDCIRVDRVMIEFDREPLGDPEESSP